MEQTTESADRSRIVDLALARSVLYGAVARAFQRPRPGTIDALASSGAQRALRDAAHLLDSDRPRTRRLLPAVRQLTRASEGTLLGDLVSAYNRLFGHTARGPVCPYETEYGSTALFQQPQALADIAGSYRAFGMRTNGVVEERVDHIGCESEFMMFLAMKEAYTIEALVEKQGAERVACRQTLEETRKAGGLFLGDHLGRFGRAFAGALTRDDQHGFYGCVARVLYGLLELDCERRGVPLGPRTVHLRSDAEDQIPMGCEDGSQLIQIQRHSP